MDTSFLRDSRYLQLDPENQRKVFDQTMFGLANENERFTSLPPETQKRVLDDLWEQSDVLAASGAQPEQEAEQDAWSQNPVHMRGQEGSGIIRGAKNFTQAATGPGIDQMQLALSDMVKGDLPLEDSEYDKRQQAQIDEYFKSISEQKAMAPSTQAGVSTPLSVATSGIGMAAGLGASALAGGNIAIGSLAGGAVPAAMMYKIGKFDALRQIRDELKSKYTLTEEDWVNLQHNLDAEVSKAGLFESGGEFVSDALGYAIFKVPVGELGKPLAALIGQKTAQRIVGNTLGKLGLKGAGTVGVEIAGETATKMGQDQAMYEAEQKLPEGTKLTPKDFNPEDNVFERALKAVKAVGPSTAIQTLAVGGARGIVNYAGNRLARGGKADPTDTAPPSVSEDATANPQVSGATTGPAPQSSVAEVKEPAVPIVLADTVDDAVEAFENEVSKPSVRTVEAPEVVSEVQGQPDEQFPTVSDVGVAETTVQQDTKKAAEVSPPIRWGRVFKTEESATESIKQRGIEGAAPKKVDGGYVIEAVAPVEAPKPVSEAEVQPEAQTPPVESVSASVMAPEVIPEPVVQPTVETKPERVFKTEKGAKASIRQRKLEGYEPVQVDGGFKVAKAEKPVSNKNTITREDVISVLSKQDDNKGKDSERLGEWVPSEEFYEIEIPIDSVGVATKAKGTSKTKGPIIVDENVKEVARHDGMYGTPPKALVIDGKHRVKEAKERGEKTIRAFVGKNVYGFLTDETNKFKESEKAKAVAIEAYKNNPSGGTVRDLEVLVGVDEAKKIRDEIKKAKQLGPVEETTKSAGADEQTPLQAQEPLGVKEATDSAGTSEISGEKSDGGSVDRTLPPQESPSVEAQPAEQPDEIFVRKPTKAEKNGGGTPRMRGFEKLPDAPYGYEKVYKPYGESGEGYYYKKLKQEPSGSQTQKSEPQTESGITGEPQSKKTDAKPKRGQEIIATDTVAGTEYEFRVGPVNDPTMTQMTHTVQMRRKGSDGEWESSMTGLAISRDAAIKKFVENYHRIGGADGFKNLVVDERLKPHVDAGISAKAEKEAEQIREREAKDAERKQAEKEYNEAQENEARIAEEMKSAKGKKGTFKVKTEDGLIDSEGTIFGDYVTHKSTDGYSVTHIPSGMAVKHGLNNKEARELAYRMSLIPEKWDGKVGPETIRGPGRIPEAFVDAAKKMADDFISRKPIHHVKNKEDKKYSTREGAKTDITEEQVQRAFGKAATVAKTSDTTFDITTPSGKVTLEVVDRIPIDEKAFEAAYGRKATPEEIDRGASGMYQDGRIQISPVGDQWTITHEEVHWLMASGVLSFNDARAILRSAGVDGRNVTEENIGEYEEKIAGHIESVRMERAKPIGRAKEIIRKILDFVDGLVNLVGVRTARGVVKDIESGNIYKQTETEAFNSLSLALGSSNKWVRDVVASLDKPGVDSLNADSKDLADLLERAALLPEYGSGTSIPRDVAAKVFSLASTNKKVFDAIIRLMPVDMVNELGGKQLSPEMALNDISVLKNVFSILAKPNVSPSVEIPAAISYAGKVARFATELSNLAKRTLESFATGSTSDSDSIFGAHTQQYSIKDITKTRSFLNWFGDSKVVDENGKPLVVYHGTTANDFSEFSMSTAGANTVGEDAKLGIFFTSSKEVGNTYALPRSIVYNLNKDIQIDLDKLNEGWNRVDTGGIQLEDFDVRDGSQVIDIYADFAGNKSEREAARQAFLSAYGVDLGTMTLEEIYALSNSMQPDYGTFGVENSRVFPVYLSVNNPKTVDAKGYYAADFFSDEIKKAKNSGHDGVIFKNTIDGAAGVDVATTYVVFDPTQIKSAVGNRGTFDSANPDIRYSTRVKAQSDFNNGIIDTIKDYGKVLLPAKLTKVGKQDLNRIRDLILRTPAFFAKKVHAVKAIFDASQKRVDRFWNLLNEMEDSNINGEVVNTLKQLDAVKKLSEEGYNAVGKYLTDADKNDTGFRIKIGEDDKWAVVNPKGATIQSFESRIEKGRDVGEDAAIEHMLDAEGDALTGKGFTKDQILAVRAFRMSTNKGFDLSLSNLKRVIALHEKSGTEMPTIKAMGDDGKMKAVSIREVMNVMGERRGTYFPRIRKPGTYILTAKKEGKDNILEKFSLVGGGMMNKRADELRRDGWTVETSKEQRVGEDVFQLNGDLIKTQQLLDAAVARVERGDFSDKDLEAEMLHMITTAVTEQVAEVVRERGARVHMNRRSKEYWSGYEMDPKIAISSYIRGMAAGEAKREMTSSMMKALTGTEVTWDRYQDIAQYDGDYASWMDENQKEQDADLVTKEMFDAINDPEWAEQLGNATLDLEAMLNTEIDKDMIATLKKDLSEKKQALYKRYNDFVKAQKIDNREQPVAFEWAKAYISENTRNQEAIDRVIGTLRGIAVGKYLAFRVFAAPLTNLTSLPTSTIATMKTAGIPYRKTYSLLTQAIMDYGNYRLGRLKGDKAKVFDYIHKNGYDNAQYNSEAMSTLRSAVGKKYDWIIELGMKTFSESERLNRAATIAATYHGLEAKYGDEKSFEELMDMANETAKQAHGIYNKGDLPFFALGKHPAAHLARMFYVFKKFSHVYLQNMARMGLEEKDYGAVAHMLISPAILAGAGASIAMPIVSTILKAFGWDEPEEEIYRKVGSVWGDSAERFARFGASGAAGVSLKGSLQMDIGDSLFGAPGSVLKDTWDAMKYLSRGDISKGVEKALPTGLASPFKATREYTEGLTTKSNAPLFYGREQARPNLMEAFLRGMSLNPVRIATIRETQSKEYEVKEKYRNWSTDIYAKAKRMKLRGRMDQEKMAELLGEITKYNEGAVRWGLSPITKKSIKKNLKRNFKASRFERERSERNN